MIHFIEKMNTAFVVLPFHRWELVGDFGFVVPPFHRRELVGDFGGKNGIMSLRIFSKSSVINEFGMPLPIAV